MLTWLALNSCLTPFFGIGVEMSGPYLRENLNVIQGCLGVLG